MADDEQHYGATGQSVYDPEPSDGQPKKPSNEEEGESGGESGGEEGGSEQGGESGGQGEKSEGDGKKEGGESKDGGKDDGGKSLFNDKEGGDKGKKKHGVKPANNRGLYLVFGGLASVLVPIAILIFFLLGALELPNFVTDMTNYEFARVTRNIATADTSLTAEKLALASQDDSTYAKITSKFYKAKGIIGEMTNFNVVNAIAYAYSGSIAKTLAPLQLGFSKESGGLFRSVLTTVTINGEEYTLKQGGFLGKVVPGLNFARQVSFARDFVPDLQEALRIGSDVGAKGFLERGVAMSLIRQSLGVARVAWKVGQYTGKTNDQADTEDSVSTLEAVDQAQPSEASTGSVQNGENAAEQELQDLENETGQQQATDVKAAVVNGGFSPKLQAAVNKAINGSLSGIVNIVSPTYQIATTVCLIYDDSMTNPHTAQMIDGQDANDERAAVVEDAAGDEAKTKDSDPVAVGARVRQLRGTEYGIAQQSSTNTVYQAANGQQRDTSQYQSPQSTSSGEFTIFNAIFSGDAGSFFNSAANAICPAATNLGVGMALGGITLLSCFTPAAPDCLGAKAAEDGAKTILGRLTSKLVTKIASERAGNIASALSGVLTDGLKNIIKVGGSTAALTYLAKALVYTKSFTATSGLASGPDWAAQTDEGNNLIANQESQQYYYGRPLDSTDLAKSQNADNNYLQNLNKSQGAFDRYFALSNPQSLLSKLAIATQGMFTQSFFRNFATMTAKILSPVASLGQVFSVWQHNKVLAAASSVNDSTNYYGIIQWGFSEDEDNLISNDATYGAIENEQILNYSNESDAIAAKYGTCFTSSVGTLQTQGLIVRADDGTGNVLPDQGLCSPDNLSYNSPDPIAYDGDPDSSHQRDLIFRYRLEQDYKEGLTDLTNQGNGVVTS